MDVFIYQAGQISSTFYWYYCYFFIILRRIKKKALTLLRDMHLSLLKFTSLSVMSKGFNSEFMKLFT
jgi:hypothetical protein